MEHLKITKEMKIERLKEQLAYCQKKEPQRKDKIEELKLKIKELIDA